MVSSDYQEFLGSIVAGVREGDRDGDEIATIYHVVRAIPYGAAGQRDPQAVYKRNIGSCSGKHILLRDLLRKAGHEADAVTIFTYFNKGVPDGAPLPAELRRMVREENVPDFHHYVRARRSDGDWLKLDATWHDRLIDYGFPVNKHWRGDVDTMLAADPIREYPPAEDLAAFKRRLIDELPAGEAEKRTRFFKLLTDWMATL